MVKFIQKNGKFFLRKPYDFALHPDGARLLFSQKIELNQSFDDEYFKILCSKSYVANSHASFSDQNSTNDNQEEDGSEEEAPDSLADLLDAIREIENRFSDYGIEIEVSIKPSKSN